jgi:hypothetical protein
MGDETMFLKRIVPTILVAFSTQSSLFGFEIFNLTNSEKVLQLQEAYRPQADKPGNLAAPIPVGYSPYEVSIPANSMHTFRLREPCSVLLVSMVTTKTTIKGHSETVSTSTATTCYEPYSYQGSYETHITDDWGLVIHKPIENQKPGSFFDPDYAHKSYIARRNLEQGYGIKCLHPRLVEKITSLEELPEELTK